MNETKIMKLSEALIKKEKIEKSIINLYDNIKDENSIESGSTRNLNIEGALELKEKLQEALIKFKEEISKANQGLHENDTNSNNYYIFKRSILDIEKNRLYQSKHKLFLREGRKNGIIYKLFINRKTVRDRIEEINQQIAEIDIKLLDFNNDTLVSIEYDPIIFE